MRPGLQSAQSRFQLGARISAPVLVLRPKANCSGKLSSALCYKNLIVCRLRQPTSLGILKPDALRVAMEGGSTKHNGVRRARVKDSRSADSRAGSQAERPSPGAGVWILLVQCLAARQSALRTFDHVCWPLLRKAHALLRHL